MADGDEEDGEHEHDAEARRRGDVLEQRDGAGGEGHGGGEFCDNERRVPKARGANHYSEYMPTAVGNGRVFVNRT